MGSYLNPGNFSFCGSLRSKIYVDKSELIAKTNEVLCTEQRYICVSRPRRFGKSMAANMLAAYYDRSENTEELFQNLAIREDKSYKENLNQYDVIKINMQEFLSMSGTMEEMLEMLKNYLAADFEETYPEVRFRDEKNLIQVMKDVFSYTRCPFVILIDEWDCLFREYKQDKKEKKKYLDFLRAWLKDKDYVVHRPGLYDWYSSDQEIWISFRIKYVYRVFHDRSRRSGGIFWFHGEGGIGSL